MNPTNDYDMTGEGSQARPQGAVFEEVIAQMHRRMIELEERLNDQRVQSQAQAQALAQAQEEAQRRSKSLRPNGGAAATPAPVATALDPRPSRKPAKWPSWDGKTISFSSYLHALQLKIECDASFLGSDKLVCLEIFQSLPESKRPRVAPWFEQGGKDGQYNWREFFDVIREKFEDRQALQHASDLLMRIRMGKTQSFVDFLQDFEYRLSLCSNLGWNDQMKTIMLHERLNDRLKETLLPADLPEDNFDRWVDKVKGISSRLERIGGYRSADGTGSKTWFVRSGTRGADSYAASQAGRPSTDADGDVRMAGVNALSSLDLSSLGSELAATLISSLNLRPGQGPRSSSNDKPLAPCRSDAELEKSWLEGKCFSCGGNHRAPRCPKFKPNRNNRRRPAGSQAQITRLSTGAKEPSLLDLGEEEEPSLSGNA